MYYPSLNIQALTCNKLHPIIKSNHLGEKQPNERERGREREKKSKIYTGGDGVLAPGSAHTTPAEIFQRTGVGGGGAYRK